MAAVQQIRWLPSSIGDAKKVMGIINLGNAHWVSVDVNFVDRSIVIFDSLRSSFDSPSNITKQRVLLFA